MVDVTPIPKPPKREKKPRQPMRRSWLNPMSQKRRDALPDNAEVRKKVFERDGNRCQLRGLVDEPCYGRRTTFHHLKKAGAGGDYDEENGVTLCANHNQWVEREPILAKKMGLVIR